MNGVKRYKLILSILLVLVVFGLFIGAGINNFKTNMMNDLPETIIFECDSVFYVVKDNNYVCYNEHMVYEFSINGKFEFIEDENYNLETYYVYRYKILFLNKIAAQPYSERNRIILRSED